MFCHEPFTEMPINTLSAGQNKTRPSMFPVKADHMKTARSQRRKNAAALENQKPHHVYNQEMIDEGRRRLQFSQADYDKME